MKVYTVIDWVAGASDASRVESVTSIISLPPEWTFTKTTTPQFFFHTSSHAMHTKVVEARPGFPMECCSSRTHKLT